MADTEPRLTTPHVRVVLDDGTEHEVRVLNVDMVAFDRDRGRHRDWPDPDTGPMFWATYLAWHALTRLGLIPKCSQVEFENRALQVEIRADDGGDRVDPTQPVAEPA